MAAVSSIAVSRIHWQDWTALGCGLFAEVLCPIGADVDESFMIGIFLVPLVVVFYSTTGFLRLYVGVFEVLITALARRFAYSGDGSLIRISFFDVWGVLLVEGKQVLSPAVPGPPGRFSCAYRQSHLLGQ